MNNMPPRRIISKISELTARDLELLEYYVKHRFQDISDSNEHLRAVLAIVHWLHNTNTMLRPDNIVGEKAFEFH